jgi:4-hydroxybenzoate polyprenyltransferase
MKNFTLGLRFLLYLPGLIILYFNGNAALVYVLVVSLVIVLYPFLRKKDFK